MFDWDHIANETVVMAIGGIAGWVLDNIRRLRRDMNAAFEKIRALEKCNQPGGAPPDKEEKSECKD